MQKLSDSHADWIPCDCCGGYICTIHNTHAHDCDCPPIDEWGDIDPYSEKPMTSTPSQQAKLAGLKSLTTVSDITGVSLQTLTNWHKDKPKLFKAVVAGCVALTIAEMEALA